MSLSSEPSPKSPIGRERGHPVYDADLLDGRDSGFTETHFFRAVNFESLLAGAGLILPDRSAWNVVLTNWTAVRR